MNLYNVNRLIQIQDYIKLFSRNNKRSKNWAKVYKKYLKAPSLSPPLPVVLQIIPTELCNLRCKMCNQWGDNGYFLENKRPVSHMPIEKLTAFLDSFKRQNPNYLLSIHGGEPFCYKDMSALLDYIYENKIDTFFSTNGTLINKFATQLAKINKHTFYLLSIDGGAETNDYIRGKGITDKIIKSIKELEESCIKQKSGLPKLIVNYCVNEYNLEDIDNITSVAKEAGALTINYNLRWFLPEEKGVEYNKIIENEFKVTPTNTWTGWKTESKFEKISEAIDKIYSKKNKLFPPYYTVMPRDLTSKQAKLFYTDYNEIFDLKSCIMPSYMVRIHSSGEMIYCPGYPDIVPGNVFNDDFKTIYLNKLSTQLRKRVEKDLLPICNRCCGLYMTYSAKKYL